MMISKNRHAKLGYPNVSVNGPGGGGGGTASLKVGTNCQTTAPAFRHCPPLSLFLLPPIFEGIRPLPPQIKHNQYKFIYKSDPRYSTQLSI